MMAYSYKSRTLRIVQVWHIKLTFDILGLLYEDRLLTLLLNNSVLSRAGHDEGYFGPTLQGTLQPTLATPDQ